MEKFIVSQNCKILKASIDTDAEVEIIEGEGPELKIKVEYENPNLKFVEKRDDDKFIFKILDPVKKEKDAEFVKGLLKNNFFEAVFNSFQKFSEAGSSHSVKELIKIKIELPAASEKLILNMNCCTINMKGISPEKLKINGNNIKVELSNCKIATGKMSVNNSKLQIPLGEFIKRFKIDANNSSIKFTERDNFPGLIKCVGIAVSVKGKTSGNSDKGIVSCDVINSKIKIYENLRQQESN